MTSLKLATLRALEPPSHIDRLLQSLVKSMAVVPDEADVVHDCSELPSSWLREIAFAAGSAGDSWRGWIDGKLRVWLFIAKLSLPLSRALGAPVLQVDFFRENGLSESANWTIDRDSRWQRCLIKPPPDERPTDELTLTAIDFYRPSTEEN